MKQKFTVIDGSKDRAVKRSPAKLATCPECNGATFFLARSQVVTDGEKYEGGIDELVCAQCLTEGKLTTI